MVQAGQGMMSHKDSGVHGLRPDLYAADLAWLDRESRAEAQRILAVVEPDIPVPLLFYWEYIIQEIAAEELLTEAIEAAIPELDALEAASRDDTRRVGCDCAECWADDDTADTDDADAAACDAVDTYGELEPDDVTGGGEGR